MNPHQATKDFEVALCAYTGAKYAVAVNSCTMALLLACAWFKKRDKAWYLISIPRFTYISVPMSIKHAGHRVEFRDEDWLGMYQLSPLPVWDCARWFTGGMYGGGAWIDGGHQSAAGQMLCVSFHASKTLGDTQGGAILHDSPEADAWLRRARFDGRTEGVAPKDDNFEQIGYHCYLSPDVSARLLLKLYSLPKHNDPLPNDEYPDLSLIKVFQ